MISYEIFSAFDRFVTDITRKPVFDLLQQ